MRGEHMTINEIMRYTDDVELLERAENLLRQIEENGSGESKQALALLLEGLHNKNLEEEVFELYKGAAEDGTNPDALLKLATLYSTGKGCRKDTAKCFACCYEAVNIGSLDAESYLARLFRDHSMELALYWAEHAANQDHPQGLMDAGSLLDRLGASRRNGQKYFDAATGYYRKAASLGVSSAKSKTTLLGKLKRVLRW